MRDSEAVVELLADLAGVLLAASAEGTLSIRDTVREVARAHGVRADVLVLPDQLLLVVEGAEPRLVQAAPGLPLDRIEAVKRFEEAHLEPAGVAREEVAELAAAPPPYPWWLRLLGVVLFATGFAPSVVPSFAEMGVTLVLATPMAVLYVLFTGRRWEPVLPLTGSFLVGVLALWAFPGQARDVGPVLLMVPALFVVIPGDYLSAAAGELAVGRISAGGLRLIWALFLLGQIVIGVVLAAQVTGFDAGALLDASFPGTLPWWMIVLMWVPFTIGLAWAFGASMRNVPLMTALVLLTYVLFAGVSKIGGDLLGTLVAASVLGAAASVLSRPAGRPPRLELTVGGFFVLTVGSLGLRGVTALLSGHPIEGAHNLGDFILLVPTVALGLVIGFLATRPDAPGF